MGLEVSADDPARPDVRSLLEQHLALMHAQSPPEDVHALDLDGLLDPSVSFFSCRSQGELLAVGALKLLSPDLAEVKSMHVAESARGQGISRVVLAHLLDVARLRGVQRVSLETGSQPEFAAARGLYLSAGFEPCVELFAMKRL